MDDEEITRHTDGIPYPDRPSTLYRCRKCGWNTVQPRTDIPPHCISPTCKGAEAMVPMRPSGKGPWPYYYSLGRTRLYAWSGEYRSPRRGEFYLSGAIPQAWEAPNDLNDAFFILRPATEAESRCPHCKRPY